jgi:mannose-1-phosphate guanylyltransferase
MMARELRFHPNMEQKINGRFGGALRCGIVLAGGDGRRLGDFVRRELGITRPKQYINFIGKRSLLEHTLHRAEKLIAPERLYTIVTEHHLRNSEVRRQLAQRPNKTVIVQPENKDTGPGLLLPLHHLHGTYPRCTVAVFPSDHFIVEEDVFMVHVYLAFRLVERDPSRVVLLGIQPSDPEAEYGYILPGRRINDFSVLEISDVEQFIEKPESSAARSIIRRGGLWNSFVMIFKPETLLNKIRQIATNLYRPFRKIQNSLGEAGHNDVVRDIYARLEPMNLSRIFLESLSSETSSGLTVMPVRGVHWSDWGSKNRIVESLMKAGFFDRFQKTLIRNQRRLIAPLRHQGEWFASQA